MTEDASDVAFLGWLIQACGYLDPRPIGRGRYAAIMPLAYTCAIITGRIGDMTGFEDRWCYHDYVSARMAFDAWDGIGEPEDWHRHPGSGRRRCEGPGEFDDHGREVAVGAIYVRL